VSATEVLRRLLDERGVEYGGSDAVVYFADKRGYKACAYDAPRRYGDGVLCVCHTATPEQAIAATLGNDECEIETTENWLPAERYHRCKHCGAFFAVMNASGDIQPCVCPNCGKKVKR